MKYGNTATVREPPDAMLEERANEAAITVAICGSFRRAPEGLRADHRALTAAGCRVLSPRRLDWAEELDGFVFSPDELGRSAADVEQEHLSAMRAAHFIWLHAPAGYVGRSASMELGYAHALGLPVFSRDAPEDVTLAALVQYAESPSHAVARAQDNGVKAPALGIDSLQRYYLRASAARGWENESAADCLQLLAGEVEELAEAIALGGADSSAAILEMADVQLYLVHLANIGGVRLSDAVVDKERINASRFGPAVPSA